MTVFICKLHLEKFQTEWVWRASGREQQGQVGVRWQSSAADHCGSGDREEGRVRLSRRRQAL